MDYETIIDKALKKAKERRMAGAKEYGDLSFMSRDNLDEIKEELYDIINYALFALVQVEATQQKLSEQLNNNSSN